MNYEVEKEEILELMLGDAQQEIEQLKVANAQLRIILSKMQEAQDKEEGNVFETSTFTEGANS